MEQQMLHGTPIRPPTLSLSAFASATRNNNHKRPATPTPLDKDHRCSSRQRLSEMTNVETLYGMLNEEMQGLRDDIMERDEAIRVLGARVTEQDGEIARLLRKVVDAETAVEELKKVLETGRMLGEEDMMEQ